jgi:hypothetical protein
MNAVSRPSEHNVANGNQHRTFTFEFERAVGRGGALRYTDDDGRCYDVDLTVTQACLGLRSLAEIPPEAADLLELAAAIQVADRLSRHNLNREQRLIRLVVPLRCPALLAGETLSHLSRLLNWTTGTRWDLDFPRRTAPLRVAEQQPYLLPPVQSEAKVTLWSGGLDALAGVYRELRQGEAPIMLVGTGGNDRRLRWQRDLYEALRRDFPDRLYLFSAPLRFRGPKKKRNPLTRARGVVFGLVGSAAALLNDRGTLYLHENGIGAINLPLRSYCIGLDQSRSVHPKTLLYLSRFIASFTGQPFSVENPSLFSTKGEMCRALAEDGRTDLVALSESCDSYQWHNPPHQCGYCSSCLLRRQALAVAGLSDPTRYIITDGRPPCNDPSPPLRAMLAQADELRLLLAGRAATRWERLTGRYPLLDPIVDEMAPLIVQPLHEVRSRFLRLYREYTHEWEAATDLLSPGILDWTPPLALA